uniref:hypothetical protein n=1 Tax=Roseburia inulinivorans TaxID=360807 RepID=UPI0026DD048B
GFIRPASTFLDIQLSNSRAPHSQNRSFRAIFLLMWLLRQRNFQNYAHSCKHDSQIYENCLGSE